MHVFSVIYLSGAAIRQLVSKSVGKFVNEPVGCYHSASQLSVRSLRSKIQRRCTYAAVALPGVTSQRRAELTRGFDCSAHSEIVAQGYEK
jgi:hypothetical protein